MAGGVGPLLLRAAALGGLTAAAWLLSGTSASASTEEPLKVDTVVEALVQLETPADPATEPTTEPTAELTAAPTTEEPRIEKPDLLADPAGWATALTTQLLDRHQPIKSQPIVVPPQETEPAPEEEETDEGPVLDFTGGTHSNTRTGRITNEAPPEVIQAKAQARAARLAAKAAAQLPPPPPAPVISVKKIVPRLHEAPVTLPAPKAESTPTEIWTAPGPDLPLPVPQQAPVTATASASSSHSDNSGGTRGVLAVLTSHNSLFPPSTWSVEERRDARSPGSLPGLPSTSPD